MYLITIFFALLCISSVIGTIYQLNATEYSRMPPLYALDDYDVCMEQSQAVYCVINLDLYTEQDNPLMHTIREYSMDVNRHYDHTKVDRGVCVNTSCRKFLKSWDLTSDRQLHEVLQQCMNDTFQRQYGLSARLAPDNKFYCDRVGERDDITFADWSFLIVSVMLVLTVIGATIYDKYLKNNNIKDQGNEYILSFSLDRNWNVLLNSDEDAMTKNLSGLHGTRSVINILTLSVHLFLFFAGGFQTNPHNLEKSYNNVIGYIFRNGLVIVQVFFFISGFLVAINMTIYSETQNLTWKRIIFFMFKRFLRLSPGLVMLIWFTSTWLRHLGSGPLWKLYITNSVVADCHKYWWSHLLYISNYVPDNRNCAIQTWHIAADTQMYLLALVVLMATMKGGRWSAMLILLLLGTLAPAVHVWLTDLDAMALLTPEFYRTVMSDTFFRIHIAGHNNMQNYLIGMAVGMFYYNYQRMGNHIYLTEHFCNYKRFYATSHFLTIPAYAYFFYLCHVFYEEKTPLLTRVLFAAVQRLIVAVITIWLILGYALQAPGILRNTAESRIWLLPSRLTYSVYLVHMNVVHVLVGSRQYTSDIGDFLLVIIYLGVLFLSYLLALMFFLVVEAPFNGIAKVMLTPSQLRKKNKNMTTQVNEKSLKNQ